MKTFSAYVRVSTQKQGEGVSLDEQRDAIARYAQRTGLVIGRWYEDRLTATVQGRPSFTQMLRDLSTHAVAGVIVHKVDRSARNLGDWHEITELLDRGFDVHVAHDGIDLRSRAGRLTGDVLAVLAADYSRNLREEVRKGITGRLKQGLLPRPAPVGYRDNGGGQAKTIDPITGPLVRALFEQYSTGRSSMRALSAEAATIGLRMRSGRAPQPTQIAQMLRNPFYAGLIRVKKTGQTFPGRHDALVTGALFERVQTVLNGRAPRRTLVHDFLFRRVFSCAYCGRHLIGELQKGRVYYRCHARRCPTVTIREDVAERRLLEVFGQLRLDESTRRALTDAIRELCEEEGRSRSERLQAIRIRLTSLADRERRLTDAYLEGTLENVEYGQRKTALLMERHTLETALCGTPERLDPAASIAGMLELADQACLLYEHALPEEKRALVDLLTSNRVVDARKPHFTLASPFNDLVRAAHVHSGGPSRHTGRTRSVAKRLLRKFTNFIVTVQGSIFLDRLRGLPKPRQSRLPRAA